MTELDPNRAGVMRKIVREMLTLPARGTVTKVWTHTEASDQSNHEVNVNLHAQDQEHRQVPVSVPLGGAATVPEVGDEVLVEYLGGDGTRPVVTRALYTDKVRAPLGEEGDVRVRRGSLYTELAGDGSVARIAKKPGDLDTPSARVELASDGSVRIETDGDVTISAGGQVVIDEGGDAAPVARQDHSHDFSYVGGGKNSGSMSGTTGTPNEDGTQTEVE